MFYSINCNTLSQSIPYGFRLSSQLLEAFLFPITFIRVTKATHIDNIVGDDTIWVSTLFLVGGAAQL